MEFMQLGEKDTFRMLSYSEAVSLVNQPAVKNGASRFNDASDSWDCNTGWDGSHKMFTSTGYAEVSNEMQSQAQHFVRANSKFLREKGIRFIYGKTGIPIIPRVLNYQPNFCKKLLLKPKEHKVITFVVNISASGYVNSSMIVERGKIIYKYMHALQLLGYSCGLIAVEWCEGSNTSSHHHGTGIEIKKAGEYVDPAIIAYVLAHPGFLRRILFHIEEMENYKNIRKPMGYEGHCGYGRPRDLQESYYKKLTATVKNPVHITYMNDWCYDDSKQMENKFKEVLKEHGITVFSDNA